MAVLTVTREWGLEPHYRSGLQGASHKRLPVPRFLPVQPCHALADVLYVAEELDFEHFQIVAKDRLEVVQPLFGGDLREWLVRRRPREILAVESGSGLA